MRSGFDPIEISFGLQVVVSMHCNKKPAVRRVFDIYSRSLTVVFIVQIIEIEIIIKVVGAIEQV